MECLAHYLLVYKLIWIVCLLKYYEAKKPITIYGSNCSQDNQYVMYLKSKQKGNFNLTRANFPKLPDLHECHLKVKFDKKYSYFTKNWEKISLEVNIPSADSCLYDIDIFIGDPSRNKAITTLNCKDKMKWTGQWPSFEVVLKFKYRNYGKAGNDNAMVTSVRFSTCKQCYKAAKVFGYRKRDILTYNYQDICLDSYAFYTSISFHGSVTFRVQDDVPVCFEIHDSYYSHFEATMCTYTVEIDREQVLELEYNIWNEWCIPWNLKDKLITFNVQKRPSSSFCRSQLIIKTNTTKTQTSCPTALATTTKEWIDDHNDDKTSWDINLESNDYDYSEVSVAGVAVSILGIFCFIFSKMCKTGDDDANIARLAPEDQGHNIHQMKTLSDQQNTVPLISPSASSSYPGTIRPPEQGSRDPTEYSLLQQQTIDSRNENELNEFSETTDSCMDYYPCGYHNTQYGVSRAIDPQQVSVDQYRTDMAVSGIGTASEGVVDDSALNLPPPPSYEEVCENENDYK